MSYGPHLMLDIKGVARTDLESLQYVWAFLNSLPRDLKMNKLIPPYVIPYDGGAFPEDHGITGMVIIAESHISIHTYPKKGYAFIDVFSCKPFDHDRVVAFVQKYFNPTTISENLIHRGRDFPRG